jgi:colanic acid/amylovoran biosynthesis glycosyltransferase
MDEPGVVLSSTRLGYLVSQYPAVNHTHILREIRGLRELGFEIHVVSIRPPDRVAAQLTETEKDEARATFTVLRAGAPAVLGAHVAALLRRPRKYLSGFSLALRLDGLKGVFYFAEAIVAGRHFERLGIAHVHSHFSSTVAMLLSNVFPMRFSATIHGSAEFEDPIGFHLREKIAGAQFTRAISDYGASQLMRWSDPEHWSKIKVVRLGVDTAVFTPRPASANAPCLEVLYAGSLAAPKGQAILIAAIDRLLKTGSAQMHLRLIGDGPMRAYLEEMIVERNLSDHVTLEGACNQDRLLQFYRQADLFALPSFAEGIPVVLMEAMAMEIPCIATWITGVPELIRHGIDGWLIPPGNAEELAAAMAKLIDDPGLRRQLGKAGRVRIQERYELARNLEGLAELFR